MRTTILRQLGLVSILALNLALMLPVGAMADERKDLAFEVIDRNAQQMTDISNSIYYFGEIGMQEFEGTKLLKDTLEAAGFNGRAGRRRHADQHLGRIRQRPAEDRDRHRDRCATRRLADAR